MKSGRELLEKKYVKILIAFLIVIMMVLTSFWFILYWPNTTKNGFLVLAESNSHYGISMACVLENYTAYYARIELNGNWSYDRDWQRTDSYFISGGNEVYYNSSYNFTIHISAIQKTLNNTGTLDRAYEGSWGGNGFELTEILMVKLNAEEIKDLDSIINNKDFIFMKNMYYTRPMPGSTPTYLAIPEYHKAFTLGDEDKTPDALNNAYDTLFSYFVFHPN